MYFITDWGSWKTGESGVQGRHFKNRPGGLKGRKMKLKVVYHHENLNDPNRWFVRLYVQVVHQPMRIIQLDVSAKSICYVPDGIHLETINLAPQLLTASRLEYRGAKPIILSRSLLQQDCMTQGLMSNWSWRLLDTAVQVFVLTKGHLKPSIKQCQTYLVQRGHAFNTPYLSTT